MYIHIIIDFVFVCIYVQNWRKYSFTGLKGGLRSNYPCGLRVIFHQQHHHHDGTTLSKIQYEDDESREIRKDETFNHMNMPYSM